MRRITRDRRLTAEQAAEYRRVRDQVAEELPDLIARHHNREAVIGKEEGDLKHVKSPRRKRSRDA